jgi:hypothetical protein
MTEKEKYFRGDFINERKEKYFRGDFINDTERKIISAVFLYTDLADKYNMGQVQIFILIFLSKQTLFYQHNSAIYNE